MNFNDMVGATGVGLLLLAYFLNTFLLIQKDGKLFFTMNIVGAALACYASVLINYVPFIILEAAWCLASIAGAYKIHFKKQ
jgi:hypothetical protein